MACFQSGSHSVHIAYALKSVIQSAVGDLNQNFLNGLFEIFWIDKFSETKLFSNFKFFRIDVHSKYFFGSSLFSSKSTGKTHSSKTKNGHSRVLLHVGSVQHCTITSGYLPTIHWLVNGEPNLKFRRLTPQPSRHTLSRGTSERILATDISATTVYSLNVDVPMKWNTFCPLQVKRDVPSGITPCPWVVRILEHKLVFGLLQNLQSLHWGM